MHRRLLVVGACALALAACGGAKGGASSPSTTAPPKSAPPDATVVADRRLADAATIRATDLPGWESTPRPASRGSEIKELARGFPGCARFVAGIRDGRVRARSPKFTKQGTTVDSDVDVDATSAAVQAQLDVYRDPAIVGCLQDVFTKTLRSTAPGGATVDSVSVSPIAVDDVGDGSYGFRLTAAVTRDGTPQTILSDLVGVAIGRVGASLSVTSTDTANLAQVETTLLPIVAQRARDAQD